CTQGFVEFGTKQLRMEGATGKTIAMFAAHGAAKAECDITGILAHLFQHVDTTDGLQVDQRTHMQTASRSMGIDSYRRNVGGLSAEIKDSRNILVEPFRRH